MRSVGSIAFVLLATVAFVSCNRDPNVVKQRYLESGNRYFEKGRFKESRIQYMRALKIDPRYGAAHYRLALADLKLERPDWLGAVKELRRAIELLKPQPGQTPKPELAANYWDSVVKLTEIYLSPLVSHDAQVMAEVEGYCKQLLEHDANSFDGHRLTGDLDYIRAVEAQKVKNTEEAQKSLEAALAEYRTADGIKTGDRGVTMQLARGLTLKSDLPGAEQYYRKVIGSDKSYIEAYRELYTLLFYQNKRADAEQLLKLGYQNNPKEYRFLIWLAEQYVIEQRRNDMLGVLQQIKSKAGEYDKAYLEVGDFYLRMGDGDSAIKEYREGMGKDSKKKPDYQKRIVEVLMRQGKRAEAADVNAQILKDNPNDSDARGVAATLMLDKGDVTKALTELQQVVTRAPDNPVAHYNLGRAYVMHGDRLQARQQFQKAIELRADYVLAGLALAQLQVAEGDYEAALRTAREVQKYDSHNVNAQLIESAALMGQKKFGDSRQLLEGMLKQNPSSPDVVFQIGVVNLAEGKYKDAEDAFRKAYQLNPANTRGLMGVVETYMAQSKVDQAIQLLQTESAKTPTRMDFHLALGNIAVRAGRWDLALAEFQRVLANTDKGSKAQGEMYLRIGETQRRKGDLQAAVQALQSARQTLPDDERVLSTLGLALDGAGRWSEAQQMYEATRKLYPNNGIVLNNLAYGMAEHGGDLDMALTLANRAKVILPNMAEIADTLSWIYLKKNLPDPAIDLLRDLVTKQPNQSTFHYHLGMAYNQKGDKGRALDELKKALASNPTKEEKQKIQELVNRLG